ncbi:MAG: ribosome small subunit-dependent GTPase A [Proteobacteria bacterium]|nr:ribosome small subunit-dependent GTPase A [Pseudomonadota bacterium]MBU1641609.1 ribosome small subunit-dependent GTPase A [Pseudomonadota bacterium]
MEIKSRQLSELGLDQWFIDKAGELCQPEQRLARVTVVDRGWYVVSNEDGDVSARATGKFLHGTDSTSDMPCVGDWVCVHYDSEDSASIHMVLPRKSFLRRKSAGKTIEFQMIAANIDVAFIVQSCHYDFNVPRLERYLVMASEGQVEPVLVLTKTDLVSAEELAHLIAEIRHGGISTRIIALSNVTGAGLDEIRELMGFGKTYCLLGSSGVGKTTLINELTGQDTLKTRAVSDSGEGRHTTVRRQLIVLAQGAMIIDTPGMREIGIFAASEGMADSFDDILELSQCCRFNNCSHTNEPGCEVLQAIQDGKLQQDRADNYAKLKRESESNEASYAEKRKKSKGSEKGGKSGMKHR